MSAAVFYKDFNTFVQTLVESMPFKHSGYPMELLAGTTLNGTEVFAFRHSENTVGGPLQGFELNYQDT